VASASAVEGQLKINGPAAPAIAQYLSTGADCPIDGKTGCTLGSIATDVRVFYGTFPGDPAQFAVAFVSTDTGGSGENLMAIILKGERGGIFTVSGHVEGIWGASRDSRALALDMCSLTWEP